MRRGDVHIGVDEADGLGANDWDVPFYVERRLGFRWLMRRWNRLSRLQRTLVYSLIFIGILATAYFFRSNQEFVETIIVKLPQPSGLDQPNEYEEQHVIPNKIDIMKKDTRIEEKFEKPKFTGPTNARQQQIVKAFKHAWKGYKKHAWGHDNLRPVSGTPTDWFTLGLTIVDSMDTAYIMGLYEEYEEAKKWVKEELVFTRNKDVNFFEVTIRVLGSLLTNYHFTGDEMFLQKAQDLGERLMAAYSSPSGIPYSDVNLGTRTAHTPEWSHYSTTAEVCTVQLEFRELSRATGNPAYEEAAAAVSEKLHQLPKKRGLVPIFINPNSGHFLPHATITLGARGDSYYEYLIKQWLQTGKTVTYFLDDYLTAVEGIQEHLVRRSTPNNLLFVGELAAGSEEPEQQPWPFYVRKAPSDKLTFTPKMDHLTCFLPGTLALGHANGLPDWHMTMAEELLYTCYLTYKKQPTCLAPEITHFNMGSGTEDMFVKTADSHNLLRPEFVESLWYMYQITGNTTYQDWGWEVFQAFEKYTRVENGYTSISNVKSEAPGNRDMMETFFLSETLKYLYLLMSDDRFLVDLNKYVVNSEAHPLPIHRH